MNIKDCTATPNGDCFWMNDDGTCRAWDNVAIEEVKECDPRYFEENY